MAFEQFSQEKARAEQTARILADREAQIRQEQALQAQIEAKRKAEEAHRQYEAHQKTLNLRNQSRVLEKLKKFMELAPEIQLQEDVGSADYKSVDYESVVDKVLISRKKVGSRRLPIKHEGHFRVAPEQNTYQEVYFTVRTLPDGTITIKGEGEPFAFLDSFFSRKKMPVDTFSQSSWMNNPELFEDAIVRAYKNPINRVFTVEEESRWSRWEAGD